MAQMIMIHMTMVYMIMVHTLTTLSKSNILILHSNKEIHKRFEKTLLLNAWNWDQETGFDSKGTKVYLNNWTFCLCYSIGTVSFEY